MFNSVMRCICKHTTLAISMLNNVFSLDTKTQTIISSISMFYAKCHDVNKFSFQKNTYIDKYYYNAKYT